MLKLRDVRCTELKGMSRRNICAIPVANVYRLHSFPCWPCFCLVVSIRYLPESMILRKQLDKDPQFQVALELVQDKDMYGRIITPADAKVWADMQIILTVIVTEMLFESPFATSMLMLALAILFVMPRMVYHDLLTCMMLEEGDLPCLNVGAVSLFVVIVPS